MTIVPRPYHSADDLPLLLALTQHSNQQAPASTYLHSGDVVWQLFQNTVFDPQRHMQLWQDEDGAVLAFAWFEEPDGVVWCIHPQFRGRGLLEPMIVAWAAAQIDPSAPGADGNLWTRLCDSDAATIETLLALGFVAHGQPASKMTYPLNHRLEAPSPPAGLTIRAVQGVEEWEERVNLHRAVWHPSRVTLEAYQRLRAAPCYRPDLDLVAVAPDGALAAYCLCWLEPATTIGLFEPVGTHPSYRGQGLGQAVMIEGLRRLQASGATVAWVTVLDGNVAASRLYERVGFTTATHEYFYKKPL